jgi:cell wall-associated NlpC family hydrolase
MTDIQATLDELAKHNDKRTSVFDIEVQELRNSTVTLSGRLLNESQLDDLHRLLPNLKLDTVSVQILSRESNKRTHVATNLTGLYENPTFEMVLSSELQYGTDLEVLDEKDKWVFARQSDGYLGWVYRPYLNDGVAPTPTHLALAPVIELHAEPNAASEIVTRIVSGTGVVLQESRDGWSRVAANSSGWLPSSSLRAIADIPNNVEEKRELIMKDAVRMIGIPYLWGGTSGNGIDCSGFAQLIHRWVGIKIPRDSDMQYKAAKPVEPPYAVGDLFFFSEGNRERNITHVGVCIGGWKMIHSSRGSNGVYIDDLQESQSLKDILVSAGSFLR